MDHIETQSSNVRSFAYDPIDQRLEMRFHCLRCDKTGTKQDQRCPSCNGSGYVSYCYLDVQAEDYAALRDAKSTGAAAQQFIVGKYVGTKMP